MSGKEGEVANRGRQDRLIEERVHDPYMTRAKPKEPTVCNECGVVFADGRWQWQAEPPTDALEDLCPACQRIRDGVPAGFLELGGRFLDGHRDEIMNLVDNKVEAEKAQHPLKRLMAVTDADGGVEATFTDRGLPQSIGEAIASAYEGELDIQYADSEDIARVYWRRDD